MVRILIVLICVFSLFGCSEKEKKRKKHALDDELELIEKAKEVSKDIEKAHKKRMKDLEDLKD